MVVHKKSPEKKHFVSVLSEKNKKWAIRAMAVLAVAEAIFLVLQGATIFREKSARDVDLTAFILLLNINVIWTLYGKYVINDTPLIISGISYMAGSLFVIAGIIKYGDGDEEKKKQT